MCSEPSLGWTLYALWNVKVLTLLHVVWITLSLLQWGKDGAPFSSAFVPCTARLRPAAGGAYILSSASALMPTDGPHGRF